MAKDITIVLPARCIPPMTRVRKPTGTTEYVLKQDIQLHGKGNERVFLGEGMMALVRLVDGAINVISGELSLAIDFEDAEETMDFLRKLPLHTPKG